MQSSKQDCISISQTLVEVSPTPQTFQEVPDPSEAAEGYTYTAMPPAESGGQLYTYTTQPQASGTTMYTATQQQPYMTVINGYAPDPKKNTEKWYTVPVGYLHPTDRAGDWQSGAFDSLNKDGTVAANAPLTLSGTSDRPDAAQPVTARRQRSAGTVMGGAKLSLSPAAREQELVEVADENNATPLASIKGLPEAQQVAWARRVVEREHRRALERIPTSEVAKLSPSKQLEWARAVMKDAKAKRGLATRAPIQKKRWAEHVLNLMGAQDLVAANEAKADKAKVAAARAAKAAQLRAKKAVNKARSALPAAKAAEKHEGVKTAAQDAYGMPSLDAAVGWLGSKAEVGSGGGKGARLASGRGCGPMCMRQARISAQDAIPTD
jgi:hypothetical protein